MNQIVAVARLVLEKNIVAAVVNEIITVAAVYRNIVAAVDNEITAAKCLNVRAVETIDNVVREFCSGNVQCNVDRRQTCRAFKRDFAFISRNDYVAFAC